MAGESSIEPTSPVRQTQPRGEALLAPPPKMVGRTEAPSKRKGYSAYAVAQVGIYVVVGAILVAILVVNLGVVSGHWGQGTVTLFAADGDFILAAAAVGVIIFEVRKEAASRRDAEVRGPLGEARVASEGRWRADVRVEAKNDAAQTDSNAGPSGGPLH